MTKKTEPPEEPKSYMQLEKEASANRLSKLIHNWRVNKDNWKPTQS